ncbi:hypothetical protein SELMODRAFT_444445 [Selaginella moellendorffii]|uniref:PH domain-containing protein n=2 Tax=Selaginella moellendorffii TaxID=88036 RepID=D8SAM7_SELML|nr:hypothetical protein SELMODRAFT_444445 [Selaginella moellendorffii]
MAGKEEAGKRETAAKEGLPRESVTTTLSGMQNQRVLWGDPEIAGYLEKRGGRFTSWKRRYFVLQGYFLFYFISEQQTETPLGLIPIEGCTIKESADVGGKLRRYVFYLNIGTQHVGFSKTETYILAASSRDNLEEWTEKLVLAAESREELQGDLRCARAVVGEIRGLLALSPSEKRLFASLHGEEAQALQLELLRANAEMADLKKEIEAVSIEADRQESAVLQQLILWDIMSLTDPGREPNDDYPTLTRLQDEVRYSDEIYRLLFKKGSLFQGDGLQDLTKECRILLVSFVRQVLDLIEEHHAKIRAKAPRFSFNVDSSIYEDMFYVKAPVLDDEQATLELLARASKSDDDSDEEHETEEEFHRRFTVVQPRASVDSLGRRSSRRQSAIAIPPQTSRKSSGGGSAKQQQQQGGPRPKLFPEQQRPYQLTRSPSRGWQVTPAGGGSPLSLAPVLRKRTHFYENPNMLGSVVTGRTIADVVEEGDAATATAAAAAGDQSTSIESMRQRVQKVDPIFTSHFGPETRPPASHIKHDANSTQLVPTSAPELPPGFNPPYSRPNVLAYVKGTIPRAKSVRPLRPSEAAALAAAAAGTSSAPGKQSVTPPRSRPNTPDVAASSSSSTAVAATTGAPAATPPKISERRSISIAPQVVEVSEKAPKPADAKPRPTVKFGPDSNLGEVASAAASPPRASPPRSRPVVKFADEGDSVITITGPGLVGRASFIGIEPEALEAGPSYGRIRDFPVVVPSILNSDVGLVFPENTDLFNAPQDNEDEEEGS